MPGVVCATPGIPSLLPCGCFQQCQCLSLPLLVLGSTVRLLQINSAHIFVVDIDLLAFAAVLVDHLFVYHDFLDELIENVGVQFFHIGVLADEGQELFTRPAKGCILSHERKAKVMHNK